MSFGYKYESALTCLVQFRWTWWCWI